MYSQKFKVLQIVLSNVQVSHTIFRMDVRLYGTALYYVYDNLVRTGRYYIIYKSPTQIVRYLGNQVLLVHALI
eukprot:SAG11_NODE_36819_length_259_cov_3.456250_1_plen_72_part_10